MMDWWMHNWVGFAAGYLFFIKIITAIRDVLDTTPNDDVNAWERAVTFLQKLGGSLLTGKRPQ